MSSIRPRSPVKHRREEKRRKEKRKGVNKKEMIKE